MPASAASTLLTPDNCVFALVDHQSSTAVDVESMDRALLVNNTAGLAKTAQAVGAPIVLTTILAERGGPIFPEVMSAYPGVTPVDRTNINAWEDDAFVAAVEATGRRKIVLAGLWTEVCAVWSRPAPHR